MSIKAIANFIKTRTNLATSLVPNVKTIDATLRDPFINDLTL